MLNELFTANTIHLRITPNKLPAIFPYCQRRWAMSRPWREEPNHSAVLILSVFLSVVLKGVRILFFFSFS
jgi:hypothetical protein